MTGGPVPAVDLVDALQRVAERTPDRCAVWGACGERVTYGQMSARVLGGAAGLVAAGMTPGDGVLFAVRPSPLAVETALAVVAAGGVVVVADPGAGAALAPARLAAARPRWTMAEPLVYAMSAAPARRLLARRGLSLPDLAAPGLRHVVVGGPGWLARLVGPRRLLRWPLASAETPGAETGCAAADPDAPALVVFTSGTTDAPRAVVHSRRTLAAGVAALLPRLDLREDDVVHTDQMMVGLPVLAAGATWSMAPLGADGSTWRRTAAERAATVGYAVPSTLDSAAAQPLPRSLRLLATGGAPVTPAVVARLHAAAPCTRVLAVYGLTEALPVATAEGDDVLEHAQQPGAGVLLGDPVAGTVVEVLDGEMVVAGPQVSRAYLGAGPHDAVRTGDQGRVLPDGRLELLGRAKDMILRGVTNIYPALVEPLVEAEPGVAQAALVGVPHPRTGDETVVLAVVGDGDGTRLGPALRQRLPSLLDAAWLPDRVVVLDELPRSGRAGKVDKAVLRRLVAEP